MGLQWFLSVSIFIIYSCHTVVSVENIAARAEVQSCSGCQLRSLPDVKAFIFEDVPKYEKVVFKSIPGAPPELVLFSDSDKEIERIPLRTLSRKDCNHLVQDKGFNFRDQPRRKNDL